MKRCYQCNITFGVNKEPGLFPFFVAAIFAGSALAWQPAPMQTQPASEPAKPVTPSQTPPPAEPGLDELLGLPAQQRPADAAPKENAVNAELERKLAFEEIEDAFEQAVVLMKTSASRLGANKDAGADTQRVQEETLLKLDKLLDEARKQQQKKRKQKQSKQDQQDQDKQNQEQQNQQQSSQSQQQAQQQQAANQGGDPNVAMRSGKLNPPPGAGAAWGNLPQRLRDALMQGSGDSTSVRWEAYTREYYKKLAEQSGQGAK